MWLGYFKSTYSSEEKLQLNVKKVERTQPFSEPTLLVHEAKVEVGKRSAD